MITAEEMKKITVKMAKENQDKRATEEFKTAEEKIKARAFQGINYAHFQYLMPETMKKLTDAGFSVYEKENRNSFFSVYEVYWGD